MIVMISNLKTGLIMFNVRKLLLADIKTMKQIAPFKLLPVGRYTAMRMQTYTTAITQLLERGLTLEASRTKKRIYTATGRGQEL